MTSGWPFYIYEQHATPERRDEDVFADEREQNEHEIYQRDLRTSWLDPEPTVVDPANKS